MQLGPGQHEPQLPDVKVAFEDLDLVDPDLRLPVGVTRVKVRMPVIVEVHCDHDPKKRQIVGTMPDGAAPARRLLPSHSSRRRGRPSSHQSVSGSPSSRSHSISSPRAPRRLHRCRRTTTASGQRACSDESARPGRTGRSRQRPSSRNHRGRGRGEDATAARDTRRSFGARRDDAPSRSRYPGFGRLRSYAQPTATARFAHPFRARFPAVSVARPVVGSQAAPQWSDADPSPFWKHRRRRRRSDPDARPRLSAARLGRWRAPTSLRDHVTYITNRLQHTVRTGVLAAKRP